MLRLFVLLFGLLVLFPALDLDAFGGRTDLGFGPGQLAFDSTEGLLPNAAHRGNPSAADGDDCRAGHGRQSRVEETLNDARRDF